MNYELIDGLPLLIKWVKIENKSSVKIGVDRVIHEVLGLVEEESAVVGKPEEMKKQHGIYVETNYAFNNAMRYDISDQTTHWKTEPLYTSQVNYNFETPCLLEIYPDKAPGIDLKPGEIFKSPRTHELLMDSYDRQRRGLMIRKMYQKIAPWTTQNPIFMHLVSKNDAEVKTAIDQCVATGYEAVILSFGSHLKMEDSTAANINRWKSLADYFMINSYTVNQDWLNWNTSWWRGLDTAEDKRKWRYTLWDMDATFGHYTNYTGIPDPSANADPCNAENLPNPGGQGHTDILEKLILENPNYKNSDKSVYATIEAQETDNTKNFG